MQEWIDLIANGDVITLLIAVVVAIAVGGTGASIVNGIVASRRGIKGDVLAKDKNAIEGFTNLGNLQSATIVRQDTKITQQDEKITRLETAVAALSTKLDRVVNHNNRLEQILTDNHIPFPEIEDKE